MPKLRLARLAAILLLAAPFALSGAFADHLADSTCAEQDAEAVHVTACTPSVACIFVPLGQDGFAQICGAEHPDDDGDGWTVDEGDCDDANPDAHPGAEESIDGVDNDCDGIVDDGDADGDGFANDVDCGPEDPSVFPGAPEAPNGVDDDCDGLVDEDAP